MLKYLMLRTLGGCSVYFTCSYARSSSSSTVTWTDALSGLRALVGSVLKKKIILNGNSQGRGCRKPRSQDFICHSAVTVCSGIEEKSKYKTAACPSWTGCVCTQSSGERTCPCPLCQAGQHRHNPGGLCSTGVTHTAPGDTAGPPLLQGQHLGQSSPGNSSSTYWGESALNWAIMLLWHQGEKMVSFVCNKEVKITIQIPFFSQC